MFSCIMQNISSVSMSDLDVGILLIIKIVWFLGEFLAISLC